MAKNWTAPQIAKHKVSDGNEPLVMLTAYDAPVDAWSAKPVPTSYL